MNTRAGGGGRKIRGVIIGIVTKTGGCQAPSIYISEDVEEMDETTSTLRLGARRLSVERHADRCAFGWQL